METRLYLSHKVELRANEGRRPTIVGVPVVYNARSEKIQGLFYEYIKPGAFAESLKGDVRALVEHDPSKLLGRTSAGTMRMVDGPDCLRVEIDPPDTTYVADLLANITAGNIRGMSFGFNDAKRSWKREDGEVRSDVESGVILEVTVTAFPYYQQTEVAMRSYRAAVEALSARDIDTARRRLDLALRR